MSTLTEAQALSIAREDAQSVYRDLSIYEVRARRGDRRWFVDYELSDRTLNGGGPHYEIDATTGRISSKRYEQ